MTPQDWTNRAMWSAFLEAHNARREARAATPPTPREGRGVSRSRASLPQPQVQSNGGRAVAAAD